MLPALAALLVFWFATPAHADGPKFVVAASTRSDEQSPRRLFNAGLRAEESGNLTVACQLFMAARLASRSGVADALYARGAALRLVRILAGRDDDAASAAAVLIEDRGESSDLGPLVRSLIRRFGTEPANLEMAHGTIIAARWNRATEAIALEVELESGETRVVEAQAQIAPISAGQQVKMLVKKTRGHAAAGWTLIALARESADGWQILRVDGLPGHRVVSGVP